MGFLDRMIGSRAEDRIEPPDRRRARLVAIERRDGAEQHLTLLIDGVPGRVGLGFVAQDLQRLRLGLDLFADIGPAGEIALVWHDLTAMWGLPMEHGEQRRLDHAPPDGCRDATLDEAVREALARHASEPATIVAVERRKRLGRPRSTFTLTLASAGGAPARYEGPVPFYAAWLARPGVTVPVIVDGPGGRAWIDWPRAAVAAAPEAGHAFDDPPEGSVASLLEAGRLEPGWKD